MEHEYQDIVIKTEFLRVTKGKIKKDIEFYKTVLDKLVLSLLFSLLSTTSRLNDLKNMVHPTVIRC
jgi:hypothetical protein